MQFPPGRKREGLLRGAVYQYLVWPLASRFTHARTHGSDGWLFFLMPSLEPFFVMAQPSTVQKHVSLEHQNIFFMPILELMIAPLHDVA